MKRKLYHFIFVVACILSLCGCGNTSNIKEDTKKVIIPYSFLVLCGQNSEEDLDEMVKTANKDKTYCNKAYKKNKDIVLVSTDSQIKEYVKDNKKFINSAMKKFTKSNKLYKYELANDYSSIKLYFDETISEGVYEQLIPASMLATSLNFILLNGEKDWHFKWEVINCHTNKTVVTWNLPNDEENSFTADDWRQSYE